jgi:hypothetical protein
MKTTLNPNELLPSYETVISEINFRERIGLTGNYGIRVEKKLAHKVIEENVLLCQMCFLDEINTTVFEVVNDCEHAFYYEHPIDHMSGSNMTEIALQGVKVILHVQGEVAMNTQMALVSCNAQFLKYVEHDLPLYMTASIDEQYALSDSVGFARMTFCFIQGGDICAKLVIDCKTILKEKYTVLLHHRQQRLRRLQKAEPVLA